MTNKAPESQLGPRAVRVILPPAGPRPEKILQHQAGPPVTAYWSVNCPKCGNEIFHMPSTQLRSEDGYIQVWLTFVCLAQGCGNKWQLTVGVGGISGENPQPHYGEAYRLWVQMESEEEFSRSPEDNEADTLDCLCESPVEKQFWQAARDRIPELRPQVEVGSYRVDFGLESEKLAIEIDGHDHHKTKEQRTADAKRERELRRLGWQVIRFTGSEVFRNAVACVKEVADFVRDVRGCNIAEAPPPEQPKSEF